MKSPKKQQIHITAGQFKGRSLATPPSAHPMGARERLALFNSIAPKLPGATVLDAYAGSGALGIEALSRGATSVIFVEKSPKAATIIRQNLRSLFPPATSSRTPVATSPTPVTTSPISVTTSPTPVATHSTPVTSPTTPSAVTPLPPQFSVQNSTFTAFLGSTIAQFDIILLDPPYDNFQPADFTHLSRLLTPDGTVILSHPANFSPQIPGLKLTQSRKYANCHLSYFTK